MYHTTCYYLYYLYYKYNITLIPLLTLPFCTLYWHTLLLQPWLSQTTKPHNVPLNSQQQVRDRSGEGFLHDTSLLGSVSEGRGASDVMYFPVATKPAVLLTLTFYPCLVLRRVFYRLCDLTMTC